MSHPDWTEPRHIPALTERFCAALTRGVPRDHYLGVCHKLQVSIDRAKPHGFHWVPPALFGDKVSGIDWYVGKDASDPVFRKFNFRGPPYPIETLVRLVACAEIPADGGGKIAEISHVLGLALDIDVALRRRGVERFDDGDRPYAATFEAAASVVADVAPSYLIDGGGGMPVVWLLDRPHADIAAAKALADDLREEIRLRFHDERDWGFDSPQPLTAWTKCPGTWSAKYERVVTVLHRGERWSFERLRSVVPEHERHHLSPRYARDDDMRWLGKAITKPSTSWLPASTWEPEEGR